MKKLSLKDVKSANKRLILQKITQLGTLSRTELTAQTGLSGSTVSLLVAELLEERVLVEVGETASGGGRPRISLHLNTDFGNIAVLEIKQERALLRLFDMNMEEHGSYPLGHGYTSGNDLLISITASIFEHFSKRSLERGKLVGIGVLFEDSVTASQCTVMYSTSLSSATISLKDALVSQFHVPVLEEYVESATIADALVGQQRFEASESSVVVNIERRVLASVVLNGKPAHLRDGGNILDLTPRLVPKAAQAVQEVPAEGALAAFFPLGKRPEMQAVAVIRQLAGLLSPLCV